MGVTGGCHCGRIRFEIERFAGPFELCHCARCRKASGSAFVAGIGVRARDFRWIAGADAVVTFELPVREHPPGYRTAFCPDCGSPAPDLSAVTEEDDWFELAAGVLDDDPGLPIDRHIFVEGKAPWFEIEGDAERCTKAEIVALRKAEWKEKRGRWSRS